MRLPDKTTTLEDAVAHITDGATVMVGGFGVPGTPFALIREIREWFDGPLILSGAIATGDAVLAAEARAQASLLGKPEQMEVVAARLGKREPVFR